jgi:hypothetical protein
MPGVVLPIRISSAIRGDIISVNVYVSIEIVIVVDVDVVATPAAAPTPTATPSCPHSYADPERDRHPCGIISRRRVVNRGIGINWCAVNHYWAIGRYIYDLWIGLLDHDHTLVLNDFGFHFLLFV